MPKSNGKCWHCGKPVDKTVGNTGLCKTCISRAKTVESDFTRKWGK